MEEIKALQLVTGETVIAKVKHKEGNRTHLTAPMMLNLVPGPQGGYGLNMLPWPMFADPTTLLNTGIDLDRNGILTAYDPREDILTKYKEATSTIVTPSKPKLIMP